MAYAITPTQDSGFVLVSNTKSYGDNNPGDIYAIRTNSVVDTLWTKDYLHPETEIAYDVASVNGGYFIITGKTNSAINNNAATTCVEPAPKSDYDAFALKINSEGNPIFFNTDGNEFYE